MLAVGRVPVERITPSGIAKGPAFVMLSSCELLPEWVRYFEEDRGIGVAWPSGSEYTLSPIASRVLKR